MLFTYLSIPLAPPPPLPSLPPPPPLPPLQFELSNPGPFNKALLMALAFRWAGAKMLKKAKRAKR